MHYRSQWNFQARCIFISLKDENRSARRERFGEMTYFSANRRERRGKRIECCNRRTWHFRWSFLFHIFSNHSLLDRPQILVLSRQHSFASVLSTAWETETRKESCPLPACIRGARISAAQQWDHLTSSSQARCESQQSRHWQKNKRDETIMKENRYLVQFLTFCAFLHERTNVVASKIAKIALSVPS